MRIPWCCLSMFLATFSALAQGWLTNESDIITRIKSALPVGLKVTHTGYGDFVFEGIEHFYILIIDDSGPNPRIRINREADAQILLIPFDYDYTGMRNNEELDRFLIAKTHNYKAFFLAPETLNLLWSETRKNLKLTLSETGTREERPGVRDPVSQRQVSKEWRDIEKRIVSRIYTRVDIKDASIDDVVEYLGNESGTVTLPDNRKVPLIFSMHISNKAALTTTLRHKSIPMSAILDEVCGRFGLHWQIRHNTIFIYDDTESAVQHVNQGINRILREETDYRGQGSLIGLRLTITNNVSHVIPSP